jgi:hypothetical protein
MTSLTVAAVSLQVDVQAKLKPVTKRTASVKRATMARVPAVTNPEYLSGEASISAAASSNPLLRIGMAQNGVTLIEFPASDKFFAVHAGNSDLVTVE